MAESRVTGLGLEVLNSGGPSSARVTSEAIEVLNSGGPSKGRTSSLAVEVLMSLAEAPPPPYAYDDISYDNFGGSGPRKLIFGSSVQAAGNYGADPKNMFNGDRNANAFYWTASGGNRDITGRAFIFQFPSRRVVTELKLYHDAPGTGSNMLWVFQAFDPDAGAWIAIDTFTYNAAGPTTVPLDTDDKPYKAYRILGVSGLFDNEHWWRQLELKVSGKVGESGNRSSIVTATSSGVTFGSGDFTNSFDGAWASNGTDAWYFGNGNVAGSWLEWQFLDGPREIESIWHATEGNTGTQGLWKVQGWENGGWVDLTGAFTWANDFLTPWRLERTINTDRYRVLGISGTTSVIYWESELQFEFRLADSLPTAPARFTTKVGNGVLTAGDTRLTATDSAVTNAKANISRDPADGGKWFMEFAFEAGGDVCAFYVSDNTYTVGDMGSGPTDQQSVVWVTQNGFFGFFGGNDIDFAGSGGENGTTHRFAMALDFDVSPPKVYIRRPNEAFWRYSGDPVAGTGGKQFVNANPGPLTPGAYLSGAAGHFAQLYTTEDQFSTGMPSGYRGWAESFTPPTGIELAVHFEDDEGLEVGDPVLTEGPVIEVPAIAFADDEGFTAARPTLTIPNVITISLHFQDDGGISRVIPKINRDRRFISVDFADDAGLTVKAPTLNTKRLFLSANFQDDAKVKLLPTVRPDEAGGPFYFSWADEGAEWSTGPYGKNQEDIYSFSMKHVEGDFAQLTVTLQNPRVGLLAPGRKRWAFISVFHNGILVPLFYGRVVGIPTNMFDTLVTLTFVARPFDYADTKKALADSLRVRPYWDDLFLSPDSWEDDDTVLEARTANWHIDRVTHEVTISDIVVAEDGVIEFTESDILYDGVSVSISDAPLRSVTIQSNIPWVQSASGTGFDLTPFLLNNVTNGQVVYGGAHFLEPFLVSTFTFDGLQSDWPKVGSKIGTGWVVQFSEFNNVAFENIAEEAIPDVFGNATIPTSVVKGSFVYPLRVTGGEYHSGVDGAGFNIDFDVVVVPIGYAVPKLVVSYAIDRDFTENVLFTMKTDVQDVMTLASESDNKVVTVNANKASDLGWKDEIPLGDLRNRSFVQTPRGQDAIEHLLLIARANLVNGSRVIKTAFTIPLFDGLGLSLRKGARVHDRRLPGGQLVGKITAYEFSLNGDSGEALCTVEIESTVGRGGAYEALPGEPVYAEDDYAELDWQQREGEINLVGVQDDFTYTLDFAGPFDDGIDFKTLNPLKAIVSLTIENGSEDQRAVLAGFEGSDQATISAVLQDIPTRFNLKLLPLRKGPYEGPVGVVVQDLVIPKQIDLEAVSAP